MDEDLPATDDLWSLTVLSFGGGQDTSALLCRLCFDEGFRQQYAPGRLLAVMSDTGDEHRHTYAWLRHIRDFCRQQGVEFHFLTARSGWHSDAWRTLHTQWSRNQTVGMKAGMKSCTDNLKIKPFYRFLAEWVRREMGMPYSGTESLVRFARRYGKIRVLIGFTKGEEGRIADPQTWRDKWRRNAITQLYPLIDEGWTRQDCIDYLRSIGQPVPNPSNCRNCPYSSKTDLLWLWRNERPAYERWVQAEAAKLTKFKHLGSRNNTVWGKKTLPEILSEAQTEFGHLTDEDLNRLKLTHGHCVASKF